MIKNKLVLSVAFTLLISITSFSQSKFPSKKWEHIKAPEKLGYSKVELDKARRFAQDSLSTAACMIIVDGQILFEWGKTSKKYLTHSTRKSFLSALYGKYVDSGTINLDATMEDLGIDDIPPLTNQEKQATVRQCLQARSGVYHTALAESPAMHSLKPERGAYNPGEYWLYNNWDFNVLLSIFEQETKKEFFQTLKEDIADPIQMQDFKMQDYFRRSGDRSIHDSYMFLISARDMARFGLLMLRNGNWDGIQLIPKDWVKESTSYYSDAFVYGADGYGYMWWVLKNGNRLPHFENVALPDGTYSARGYHGHYIVIIPEYDMVVVHRVDTWPGKDEVSKSDFGKLLNLIIGSKL